MGQEIDHTRFARRDFEKFHSCLRDETDHLAALIRNNRLSNREAVAGFEIEAWLVTPNMQPAPDNEAFLKRLNSPLACAELARFNVELNNRPVDLTGAALETLHQDLENITAAARGTAQELHLRIVLIGILPTLRQSQLTLANMSDRNRFRALNEQIFQARKGRPIHIEIGGREHLNIEHYDVMIESAATSFQIHLQTPLASAHHVYNAAIIASAPCVAVGANSPYVFGRDLWAETRIPLFEQSIGVGGYNGVAQGPLRRVGFGSDYARKSIMECFTENLEHFPVLLPIQFDSVREDMQTLRLHNGTIWRWNRPLIGFDPDGTPHIRIEHRVIPAGPSLPDMLANAAFFYGLANYLRLEQVAPEPRLPFHLAKDNFYQCARYGLEATVAWPDMEKIRLKDLLLRKLIPQALIGLDKLGINHGEASRYLDIIQQRTELGQNGSTWQRRYATNHDGNLSAMTRTYHENLWSGVPVHQWAL
ncbi:MAG: glutamate-cysteine ligase family protein [Methylococcaceae bacterium]|nr:glutamate-cysteine ligase family protein [Methylococcaceae bacterium]MCI0733966.1 glutamate-cysteine ligase family protein [Methylococcaceae bacterium]